jgi:hypothetical protein
VPSTFTVTTTADDASGPISGQTTLRDAINAVNHDTTNPGIDTINFAITSPATGPWTIQPTQALPALTHAVRIDGTSQSGWSVGNPVIVLDGSQTTGANGLEVNANNCTIQGLQITSWATGIQIDAVSGTIVQGDVIGRDGPEPPYLPPPGNSENGVAVTSGATNTLIGGTSQAAHNDIEGNKSGISTAAAIEVQGNSIVGNTTGVFVAASGSGSVIGGTAAGAGNTFVLNLYGPAVRVSAADQVAILGNSFYQNGDGIVLENGANQGQVAPMLTSVVSTTPYGVPWTAWTVSGTLTGPANTTYRVEFYATLNESIGNYDEGRAFLGAQNVTTNGGATPFTFNLSVPAGFYQGYPHWGGPFVVATATDPNNNTSPFSNAVLVSYPPPSPPTPIGALTLFGMGLGPGLSLELFSVDSQGEVFAQPWSLPGVGAPVFLSSTLTLQLWGASDGQVLASMHDQGGQLYVADVFNFFNPYVQTALIDALMTQWNGMMAQWNSLVNQVLAVV